MAKIALSARPIKNPSAAFVENPDGWAVLVNLDTAGSVALNPSGVTVWKQVDGRRNVQAIIDAVRRQFSDAPDSAADDVAGLLDILAEEGLIGFEFKFGA